MRIVPVELGKNSYDIYIGNGLEQQIRDFCQKLLQKNNMTLIVSAPKGAVSIKELKEVVNMLN